MADKIAKNADGTDQFAFVGDETTRNTIWHRKGQAVDPAAIAAAEKPSDELMRAAAMDYLIEAVPVWAQLGGPNTADGLVDVSTMAQAIVRRDTDDVLAVVGGKWKPLQNADLFAPLDPLVKRGLLHYETAGVLDNGKIVFALARFDADTVITTCDGRRDRIQGYLCISGGHDGGHANIGMVTRVRIVCGNTFSLALSGSHKAFFKVPHVGDPAKQLKACVDQLEVARDAFHAQDEIEQWMAEASMSQTKAEVMFEALVPDPPVDESTGKLNNGRAKARRERLVELFSDSPGNAGTTHWDWFNATTYFADHEMPSRFGKGSCKSAWLGAGADFKRSAYRLIDSQFRIANDLPPVAIDSAPAKQALAVAKMS